MRLASDDPCISLNSSRYFTQAPSPTRGFHRCCGCIASFELRTADCVPMRCSSGWQCPQRAAELAGWPRPNGQISGRVWVHVPDLTPLHMHRLQIVCENRCVFPANQISHGLEVPFHSKLVYISCIHRTNKTQTFVSIEQYAVSQHSSAAIRCSSLSYSRLFSKDEDIQPSYHHCNLRGIRTGPTDLLHSSQLGPHCHQRPMV